MKTWHKILAGIFFIGIASANSLYATDPATGQVFDPNNYGVTPISENGKLIHFPCSDNNTGETVIIKSDQCSIVSFSDGSFHFSETNISPDDQNFQTQILDDNGLVVADIEEFLPQIPYQIDVTDYADPKTCRPIKNIYGKDFNECGYIIGSHKETRYRDEWGTITKNPTPDTTLDDGTANVPAQYLAKEQFQYWIPSGITKYFRAKIKLGVKTHGEFYIFTKGSLGAWGSLDPSWYSNSWGYRMAITIDHSKVASSTGEVYTNFPILISTTTPNLKVTGSSGHVGKSDGTDILFTLSDGTTKLNHELEKYVSTTGEVEAWVNMGTGNLSTSTDTTIYAYYGNAAAADQQNVTATWNSNYKGVWHLPDGTTLNKNDSTSNANNMSNFGSPTPAAGVGQIDGALSLSGSTGYIGKTSPSNLPTGATARTVEAWAKFNTLSAGHTVLQYGDVGNTRQTFLLYTLSSAVLSLGTWADDLTSTTTLSTGTWYHIVITYNGSTTLKLYLNGVLDTTYTLGGSLNTTLDANGISLGAWPGASAHYMDGLLDEERISNVAFTVDWIKTEYNNQNAPGTFMTWGAEESAPVITATPGIIISNGNVNIDNGSLKVSAP